MFEFVENFDESYNVSAEYIEEIENELGIKFPKILREFYMNYNVSDLKEIIFIKHDIEFVIDFIIPMKYKNVCIEKILSFNEGNEYIPKVFIPLAEDIDGDDFYWDAGSGKVYYLVMGNIENPIPICDSVEEFFELLNKSF